MGQMAAAYFDNTGGAFDPMKISAWNEARLVMLRMLPLLKQSYAQLQEEGNEAEDKRAVDDPQTHHKLERHFIDFLERLDRESYKALQFSNDVYGNEYQEILANSSK